MSRRSCGLSRKLITNVNGDSKDSDLKYEFVGLGRTLVVLVSISRTRDQPPVLVSNLRRNLEALFCPRISVGAQEFRKLAPGETRSIPHLRYSVFQPR